METQFTKALSDINLAITSSNPIVWVVSYEEREIVKHLFDHFVLKNKGKNSLYSWSSSQGISEFKEDESLVTDNAQTTRKIGQCLEFIKNQAREQKKQIFVMKDMNVHLTDSIVRELRDMYTQLSITNKVLVILSSSLGFGPNSHQSGVPVSIEKDITVVSVPLPDQNYIQGFVGNYIQTIEENNFDDENKIQLLREDPVEDVVKACSGLTKSEMIRAMEASRVKDGHIKVENLIDSKNNMIKKNNIIDIIETNKKMSDVGGLDILKSFLEKYKECHSKKAKEFGVEVPRGIILLGAPGNGKSESAKATSNVFRLPLWQLDIGRVMNSLVGSSEARIRSVIDHIEACAPLVLWIDEIEKGLAGVQSSGRSDSGTFSRVFGTLLTAMQDRMENVFIVATCNNVTGLPPELIRRFHDIFFVDLPTSSERKEILDIHLRRRNRDPEAIYGDRVSEIIQVSNGYTGAEIEKAVKEAIATAFFAGKEEIDTDDLIVAVKNTKPISKVMDEDIKNMRVWAKGRARFASTPEKTEKTVGINDIMGSI